MRWFAAGFAASFGLLILGAALAGRAILDLLRREL